MVRVGRQPLHVSPHVVGLGNRLELPFPLPLRLRILGGITHQPANMLFGRVGRKPDAGNTQNCNQPYATHRTLPPCQCSESPARLPAAGNR